MTYVTTKPGIAIDNLLAANVADWQSNWSAGLFLENSVVVDGNWTMVANKDTSLRPAPIEQGEPYYGRQDAITTYTNQTAKQLVFGVQYTSPRSFWFENIRLRVSAGHTYRISVIINPGVDKVTVPLHKYTALNTGQVDFKLVYIPFPAGTVIKVVIVVTKPSVSSTIDYNWDYSKPISAAAPATGVCLHASDQLDELWFHYNDSGGTDRSAALNALTAGDMISVSGIDWVVQSITDVPADSCVRIGVVCAYQSNNTGITAFTFDTMNTVSLEYGYYTDYWLTHGNSAFQGLYGYDTDWKDVALNNHAYTINGLLQEIILSPDWNVLAFNFIDRGGIASEISFTYDHADAVGYLNNTTVYTDVVSIATPVRSAGVYEYAISWRWSMTTISRSAHFQFSDDDGVTWHEMVEETKDVSDVHFMYYAYPKDDATVGIKHLKFQAKVEQSGDIVTISNASVIIKRVA